MSVSNVYPGSGSAISQSTPFGFYDNDVAFQQEGPKLSIWVAKKLGYPQIDIELTSDMIYSAFEESVSEYSSQVNAIRIQDNLISLQGAPTESNFTHKNIVSNLGNIINIATEYGTEAGSGGTVTWKQYTLNVTEGTQVYDLNALISSGSEGGNAIEVKEVMHKGPPAVTRFFDPLSSGLGASNLLNTFGWQNMGIGVGVNYLMVPAYSDILRLQAIEFNDMIRKSAYTFEISNNQLRLFPIPVKSHKVFIKYIVRKDRDNSIKVVSGSGEGVVSDTSNVKFDNMVYAQINDHGKQWIRRYTYALSKDTLGIVRSKYSSIPIPDSETTLDGETLRAEAAAEKDALLLELKEHLEKTTRKIQLEKEADEAEQLSNKLTYFPLSFYWH